MKPLNILVGCECSGIVRNAFRALGHDAYSCDLKRSEDRSEFHYQGDIFPVIHRAKWDLLIAHPPCDYLAVSGNRWFSDRAKAGPGVLTGQARRDARDEAVFFVRALWKCDIPRICIENPIGRLSTLWRKPEQVIQPWQFWSGELGKGEVKATCLWLKGLPTLTKTTPSETGRHPACWLASPGEQRKANRARTYPGIAQAMAAQWGKQTEPQPETASMNEITQLIIHRHFVNLGSTGGKRNTAAQQAARKLNAAKGAAARKKAVVPNATPSGNEPQPGVKTS